MRMQMSFPNETRGSLFFSPSHNGWFPGPDLFSPSENTLIFPFVTRSQHEHPGNSNKQICKLSHANVEFFSLSSLFLNWNQFPRDLSSENYLLENA